VSELKYPEWQKPYQDALLERDTNNLEAKIHLAEWKIFQRLQTVSADSDHHGEKSAIADALNVLRALKRDKLNYPTGIPTKKRYGRSTYAIRTQSRKTGQNHSCCGRQSVHKENGLRCICLIRV
jgi:hypothetical protein